MPRSAVAAAAAVVAALALGGPRHAAAQSAPSTRPQTAPSTRGRTYQRWFHEGRVDSLWAVFAAPLRAAAGDSIGGFRAFRERVMSAGAEREVVRETTARRGAVEEYSRVARLGDGGTPLDFRWSIDSASGAVLGFVVRPASGVPPTEAPSRYLDCATKTPLRLPFAAAPAGDWTVAHGGRTVDVNYHAAHRDQRFAYDILVVRDGRTHEGDGARLEQYHCCGLPILAPAAGTIVTAMDGLPDQAIGATDRQHPPGNHVVMDHGNGEYSLLAHLRQGSVRVTPGAIVAAGDTLGACGNSGNTSEPHLHYHLQDAPAFGRGEGLPAPFVDFVANGEPVARGEPVRGDRLRPR